MRDFRRSVAQSGAWAGAPWSRPIIVLAIAMAMAISASAQTAQGSKGQIPQPSDEVRKPSLMNLQELKYQDFFLEVTVLDQVQAAPAASNGNAGLSPIALTSILAPEEALLVKLVAAHCVKALNENGVAARREFGDFRSAYPAGRAMRIPPQLRQEHEAQARKIVGLHIQQLKEMLGENSFAKLDQYVKQRPEPKVPLLPAPVPAPKTSPQ